MSTFVDHVKSVITSLILSAVLVVSSTVITSQKQGILLEQNMAVTQKLSDAVTDLRIEMASSKEKFVTREELRAEIQRSVRNGS
ncbi:MAG TPA: hypothetical protein VJM50_18665 [Pyrinomonadaceae bacterium]|nr:hypothetical protein [Pyrinomonadaceae bacterium]